jgi:flagellin
MTSIHAGAAFYRVQNSMAQNADRLSQSMQRLASGEQNISPGDRTGSSAVAYSMKAEVASMKVGLMNGTEALQSIEMVTNDLAQMNDIVIRLEEIHAQGTNAYSTAQDKVALTTEADNLLVEMKRIASDATWKGNSLIKNSAADPSSNTMIFGRNTSSVDMVLDAFVIPEVALGFNTLGDDIYSQISVSQTADTGTAITNPLTTAPVYVTAYTIAFGTLPEAGGSTDNTVTPTATTAMQRSALAIDGAVFYEHLIQASMQKTLVADTNGISITSGARLMFGETVILNGAKGGTEENGLFVLDDPSQITMASSGTETTTTGTYTILGVGVDGRAIQESIVLVGAAAANSATSLNYYSSITSITKVANNQPGGVDNINFRSVGNVMVGTHTAGLTGPQELAGSDIGAGSAEAALALLQLKVVVDNMNIDAGTLFNKVSNVMSHMGALSAGYQLDAASKMDVDFAGETAELAKGQILAQAGTAMLAQANAQGQGMLALLQS